MEINKQEYNRTEQYTRDQFSVLRNPCSVYVGLFFILQGT